MRKRSDHSIEPLNGQKTKQNKTIKKRHLYLSHLFFINMRLSFIVFFTPKINSSNWNLFLLIRDCCSILEIPFEFILFLFDSIIINSKWRISLWNFLNWVHELFGSIYVRSYLPVHREFSMSIHPETGSNFRIFFFSV